VGTRTKTWGICAHPAGWQRAHSPAAFAVALAKKFVDDRASSFAALLAYYAFFSLFPLLLALVSILGFVLEGDPHSATTSWTPPSPASR